MKASDIPDTLILEYLYRHQGRWTMLFDLEFSTWVYDEERDPRHKMEPVLEKATIVPLDTPPKVLLAKMRSLYRRGLVGGCACGCRGDWEITDKGLQLLGKPRIRGYSGY